MSDCRNKGLRGPGAKQRSMKLASTTEALRRSEARYRSLVSATTLLVWITDANGHVAEDLPTLQDFTGLTSAEIAGTGWLSAIHPDDRARTAAAWTTAVAQGTLYETEYRVRRHDGQYRDMEVRGVPVRNEDGTVREWVGTCTDITHRKHCHEVLRLQTTALQAAANSIVISQRNGRIVWANSAFTQLTGYTLAEVAGENLRILKSGQQNAEFYRRLWETILAGRVWQGEVINRRKDGSLYTEEMTITPVVEDDGSISNFVAIKQDITERKRAEEALWAANENLNQLLEHSPVVLYRLRVDGEDLVPVMVTGNVKRFCGFDVAETLQYSWWIANLHPEDRDRAIASERTVVESGESRCEYRLRHKDGSYRWVEDNERLVRGTQGQPSEVVGVWTDITERKRVEEALLHSAEKYRDLFENASYGIFRSTPDGQLLDVNPAFVKMLGYDSKPDLLRMNLCSDIYRSPQRRAEILKQHETDGRQILAEAEFRRKDGQVLKVRMNGREVRNAAGELQCYEVMAEDVTQQRNLEEQLRQVQKMEAVGQLSGGVAHDFNNLLNVIMGYTQLALDHTLPHDQRHRQLEQVLAASERATSLTRQLLAFSRKQVLEPRLITLDSAIDEAEKMLRRLLGEDIRLVLQHSTRRDMVKVDPGQMLQVIINLAVNARDAMPGGGTLSIETSVTELDEFYCRSHSELAPGRYVMLAVSDTGCGMDPHIKSRIFEPFYTTKPKGKGTGLGLSTVYGIVKQSGGHIAVYSELGKGTSFKIYFPTVQNAATATPPMMRAESYRGGNETVLVVEDDRALREFALEQLKSLGYEVLAASHGEEALAITQRQSIDLLLTDVVMPGMNGRQLAERIALLQPAVRTLYVSGYTENAITHDGVLDPGIAFLGKPYKAADLACRVRELLDDRERKPVASVLAASGNAGQAAPGSDQTVA
jgi:two-component system, cell cycle sensor histidine kinase and response regulator CckA